MNSVLVAARGKSNVPVILVMATAARPARPLGSQEALATI